MKADNLQMRTGPFVAAGAVQGNGRFQEDE